MDLPALIPKEFEPLEASVNDQALYEALLGRTDRLIRFFESAAEDETWSFRHEQFYRLALNWCTEQFYQDRLTERDGKRIAEAIHAHTEVIGRLLPRPLELQIDGKGFAVNPLMLGALSPYFRELFRGDTWEKNKKQHVVKGVSYPLMEVVLEYLERGQTVDLWKWNRDG